MAQSYESIEGRRAFLTETYQKAMAKLDTMQGAGAVCDQIMAEWRDAKEGRNAHIYVGDSALMVTLDLAKDEIFADATEVFERAERAIKASLPADWEGDWSEVRDDSTENCARRQMILHTAPPGGAWYSNGVSVWLTVSAFVGEGSACQVVQIGERKATITRSEDRMVPVFKSVCPGDPVPMAAE